MAEVDHLGAGGLQDAAHDVDRGVVAVEQRGGGDEAHLVGGFVGGEVLAADRSFMRSPECVRRPRCRIARRVGQGVGFNCVNVNVNVKEYSLKNRRPGIRRGSSNLRAAGHSKQSVLFRRTRHVLLLLRILRPLFWAILLKQYVACCRLEPS